MHLFTYTLEASSDVITNAPKYSKAPNPSILSHKFNWYLCIFVWFSYLVEASHFQARFCQFFSQACWSSHSPQSHSTCWQALKPSKRKPRNLLLVLAPSLLTCRVGLRQCPQVLMPPIDATEVNVVAHFHEAKIKFRQLICLHHQRLILFIVHNRGYLGSWLTSPTSLAGPRGFLGVAELYCTYWSTYYKNSWFRWNFLMYMIYCFILTNWY